MYRLLPFAIPTSFLCWAIGGCFNPSPRVGLACSEKARCPGDQECRDKVCLEVGVPLETMDARLHIDAPMSIKPDAHVGVCPDSIVFLHRGEIESFTIPNCARTLTVEVMGAQGGGSISDKNFGGKGASLKGEFALKGGEKLKILVGGKGSAAELTPDFNPAELPQGGGSGGGGSYVTTADNTPLMIAGGGGGAMGEFPGGRGQIGTSGQDGSFDGDTGKGGRDGKGGMTSEGSNLYHEGTGGGGFDTGGVGASSSSAGIHGTANTPGESFLNSGLGGVGGSKGRNGGFGGGGSAGSSGGGGGGYSGGGSGSLGEFSKRGGGGGGSLNTGSNQSQSSGHRGHGKVILRWEK